MDAASLIAALPPRHAGEQRSFLVSPNVGLMIWTLHRLRHLAVRPRARSSSRASRRRSTSARSAIEDSIDAAERTRVEADELLAEYRERLAEAREQAEEILARARKAAEATEARRDRRGQGQARGAARAGQARHPGRDAPRDPGHPQRGRRPDDPRHGEGHAQDADRGRPAPARRGGARASSTSRPSPASGAELAMEEIAEVYGAVAVRGRPGAGQARRDPRAARAVRRRARRRTATCGLLLLAVLLDAGEEGRPDEDRRGRRPDADQLPRAADREAPHAGGLPHPALLRRAVGAGEQDAARPDLDRHRARRGDRQADRRPHRQGHRPARSSSPRSVDPDILGGIVLRVGNSILDASIRNRLDNLRKHVARGA